MSLPLQRGKGSSAYFSMIQLRLSYLRARCELGVIDHVVNICLPETYLDHT